MESTHAQSNAAFRQLYEGVSANQSAYMSSVYLICKPIVLAPRTLTTVTVGFNRKVMAPFKLSDGRTLPRGSFISLAINSIARDPEYYVEPNSFDGYRFYKLRRSSPSEANRHQFVTTGPESLPFGHGKFACPGRFLAAAQIKTILANILLNYDISFPDGQVQRPENVFTGEAAIMPDKTQMLVFKHRVS